MDVTIAAFSDAGDDEPESNSVDARNVEFTDE